MHTLLIFLLGVFYTILFCVLFRWLDKKQPIKIRIGYQLIIISVFIKIVAGIVYGYLYSRYFTESDSWSYFKESIVDYNNLLNHPSSFFSFNTNTGSILDFFSTKNNAFWSNAGDNFLIKILSVLNLFSDGNYYVSSILYNFFSFAGLYLIYTVCAAKFINNKRWIFFIIFFLPSNLFWGSGIAKEGLIAFFSGLLIYEGNKLTSQKSFTPKSFLLIIFSIFGITLMRTATALIFIPAFIAWYLSTRSKAKPYIIYATCYVVFAVGFFLSAHLNDKFNLPLNLAEKQHQFLSLQGNSKLALTPLKPTFKSYTFVLPQAFNHIFFRPYPDEIKSPFHLLTFIENLFVLLIVLLSVFSARKKILPQLLNPFALFCFSVALGGYLLIGYTVPFTGAIIRYKALYTVLLLLPFISFISSKNVYKIYFIRKKNM